MILLKMHIDNIYMFDDFNIDFTFPRKVSGTLVENECIKYAPKIRYKKVNIITGANASGKTTFGKTFLDMNNFLIGREANIFFKRFYKDKDSNITMVFVVGKYIFEYCININEHGFVEKIKYVELRKSQNLKDHISRLSKKEYSEYETIMDYGFREDIPILSKAVKEVEITEEKLNLMNYFTCKLGFNFSFASFSDKSNNRNSITDKSLKCTESFLKIIDYSIEEIRVGYSKGLDEGKEKNEKEYYIVFKNGEHLIVKDGDLRSIKDESRISQGTLEAIDIANILSNIKLYAGVIYIDEKMAYMHTQLSNTLITKLILEMPEDSQLFITSHDENVLDLNLPLHSHTFFVRKQNKISAVSPDSSGINQNGRRLIEYVQNNYFDTNPDIDELLDIEV